MNIKSVMIRFHVIEHFTFAFRIQSFIIYLFGWCIRGFSFFQLLISFCEININNTVNVSVIGNFPTSLSHVKCLSGGHVVFHPLWLFLSLCAYFVSLFHY